MGSDDLRSVPPAATLDGSLGSLHAAHDLLGVVSAVLTMVCGFTRLKPALHHRLRPSATPPEKNQCDRQSEPGDNNARSIEGVESSLFGVEFCKRKGLVPAPLGAESLTHLLDCGRAI
jgi:hypothetical protein